MRIEILSIPGCPNHKRAVARVHEALFIVGARAEILEVLVEDGFSANRLRFPGSPTIRVNNRDVDSIVLPDGGAGLQCRIYPGAENAGVPDRETIIRAVRQAMREETV